MANNMFLVMDEVDGESQDSVFTGDIDVLSWSWGASTSATTHVGSGGGGGHLDVQDLTLTKYVDKASPTLLKFLATTKHVGEAVVHIRKGGGGETPMVYLQLKMNDVIVKHYQTGGSGGEDRLMETVTLNFSKFEMIYTPQAADGTAEGDVTTEFDIAAAA